MTINTTNYFQHIKRIGFENLPLVLKQSHTVIMTKTVNGEDWKLYHSDPDLKRMIDLTFKKLEEFIKSRFVNEASPKKEKSKTKANGKKGGDKDVSGLEGTKINEQDGYVVERKFIEKTLALNNKDISKTQLNALIEELQTAIVQGKIRKSSPFKLEIEFIQKGLVSIYNAMKTHQTTIRLHENSIAMLNRALKKTNELLKSIHPEPLPEKQKDVSLKGITENSEATQVPSALQELPEKKKESVNMMSSMDFSKLNFDTIGFKGKWLDFIGDPAPGFTAMVFGMPKMGKSYLCMDFAGYLARHHGKVLYVAKEEKLNKTLQDKLMHKELAHPNLTLSDGLPSSLSDYKYVFIDSVNKYGLSSKDLALLKEKNPAASFVYVFQATKSGKFKGNNEFQHDVDIVIEVPRIGKAVQYGRYNQGGELDIFSTNNEIKEERVSQTIHGDSLPLPQTIPTLEGINKKEPMEKKTVSQKPLRELSVKFEQHSWGELAVLKHGNDWHAILHPEHLEKITALKNHESCEIKDEQGHVWLVNKEGNGYIIKSKFSSQQGRFKLNGKNQPTSKKFNPSQYANRKDDLNPSYLFSGTSTILLTEALSNKFDIRYLLRRELANRGLDADGKWVGFEKAKVIHKV